MFRALFRFLGLWILAASVIAATVDGTRSIAGQTLILTPLADTWAQLSPGSLQETRRFVERTVGAAAWDPAAVILLDLPTALILFILAALLLFAGRPKRDLFA